MNNPSSSLYYVSAVIAILGATLYHLAVKKLPTDINPIFSIAVIYSGVLAMSLILLPFFGGMDAVRVGFGKLSWVQPAIAFGVFMIEIGFILMYRAGWDLSLGNLITGVAINLALILLGIFLFGEHLSPIKLLGASLAILGVALLSF